VRRQGKFCHLACGAFALQLLECAMEQDIPNLKFSAGKVLLTQQHCLFTARSLDKRDD